MSAPAPILPGAILGVMGSGQLGRMFAIAARRMGYRVHTFSPEYDTPTGQVADHEVTARYEDETAVRAFARGVAVLTFEFENVPSQTVAWAAEHCPVRPAGSVLHVCQHRVREKEHLTRAGLPIAPYRRVASAAELTAAAAAIGLPAVMKTAAFGYDGKGQRKLSSGDDLAAAWQSFAGAPAVLEKFIPFERELSVLVARGVDGALATWPVCENEHVDHRLDLTYFPARIPAAVAGQARALAEAVARSFDLVGVLAVEMFLRPDGEILINELAPRPHNSGHASFDASVTSQFEQQVRAVCGLPLGATDSLQPAAMANLMGELWAHGEPDWAAALAHPAVKLHLYGKAPAKRGRKMGHLVAFGRDADEAAARVCAARQALLRPCSSVASAPPP
jgi:5-(carboxyamino)imidazole ribonucleotide synthase